MADIAIQYEPRPHFLPFHEREQRWASLVVHRRGGKTVACVNELLTRATYTSKKDARYAYIAPFYRQAKDVAWQYLKEFGGDLIVKIRESELRVELFNGSYITLYGADNPDALRGLYLDGVVLDEYGDCRPSLWGQVVLPTLADRKGWSVFIGTPKGKNHFYDVHRRAKMESGWYALTLRADESGILDAEELAEMRAQMTTESYNQEMLCDFEAAVAGTYYAEQIRELEELGQIAPDVANYNPKLKVFVAADLGYSDSTAFWFWQNNADGFAIIDFYENQGKKLPHYLEMLDSKGYEYDEIYLPHDAKAETLSTKRTTVEQVEYHYKNTETKIRLVPKLKVQHGIDAVRLVLPQCYINQIKCYDGVEALRAYKRSYDEVKKVFSNDPVHDWASDASDGFRYFALCCRHNKLPQGMKKFRQPPRIERPKYKLDELWKDRETASHKYAKLRM